MIIKSIKSALTIAAIALFATGCVSTKTVSIDQSASAKFTNKKLSITERHTPDFSAFTAGKALFGAIGAAATISAGNSIVRENNVQDPANYIAATLLNDLSARYEMIKIENSAKKLASEKHTEILRQHNGSDYVLDVRTINWSFTYFPSDWNNYRVIYSAKLRLLEAASNSVIAEGFCSRVPEKDENAPSKDELLADDAFVLKAELRLGANQCINEFREKVFSLPTSALAKLEAPQAANKAEQAQEIKNTTEGTFANNSNTIAVESGHPQLHAALKSGSSAEMRRSAIEIGQNNIYSDEAIFLTSVRLLEEANLNKTMTKKDKLLVDGLSWVSLNLGHSKDERARPALIAIGANETLPRKLRNHALHALKIMDGIVKK